MIVRTRITAVLAPVLATGVLLLATQAGAADTGGAAYQDPQVGGASLRTDANTFLGSVLVLRGTAAKSSAIAIQRRDRKTSGWETVATVATDAKGAYVARWKSDHIGLQSFRAVPAGAEQRAYRASSDPIVQVTVYRQVESTWYDLSGNKTSCGVKLTPTTMGVAHRSLPCGTQVAFYYKGRTITVPVIDRGPFGTKAQFDLTKAAADALGFTALGRVTLGATTVR